MLEVNGKHLHGGKFKPKDSTPEEVERARLAAVESRRKLEEKYVTIKKSEGPDLSCPVERKSPPQGDTPEDIENARLTAIKCLQTWKRGICKAGSPRSTG